MKHLILLIALLPFAAFAQFEVQYIDRSNTPSLIYPVEDESFEIMFGGTDVTTIQNPETRLFKTEKVEFHPSEWMTKKQHKASLRNRTTYTFCYTLFSDYSDSYQIPPCLDSLKDGEYVQYYSAVPIFRNDTLYAVDTCVSAIFTIKNGLLNGLATWYMPNGAIKQTGAYLDGKKTGIWKKYDLDLTVENRKEYWNIYTAKETEYSNNLKNGVNKLLYRDDLTGIVDVTEQHYRNDTLHGKHFSTFNGQLSISGEYRNGKESGSWIITNIKRTNSDPISVPFKRYTLNSDSIVTYEPFPFNVLLQLRSNESNRDGYLMYPSSQEDIRNMNTTRFTNSFNTWCQAKNCLKLGPDNSRFDFLSASSQNTWLFKDSMGRYPDFKEVAQKCGLMLQFIGKYEEYHPNGQLHFAIDMDDPANYFNFTAFYPNGNPSCIFKELSDSTFSAIHYDSLRNVQQTSIYHKWGDLISQSSDTDTLLFENRSYIKLRDAKSWEYKLSGYLPRTHEGDNFNNKVEKLVIYSYLSLNDSSTIRSECYFPKERKGIIEEGYESKLIHFTRTFQFDSSFSNASYAATLQFGSLTMKQEAQKNFADDEYHHFFVPEEGDSLISSSIIDKGILRPDPTNGILEFKNKPFTGTVDITYDTTVTELKLTESKKHIQIVINPNSGDSYALNDLFPAIGEYVGSNLRSSLLYYGYDRDSEFNEEYKLKTVKLHFSEGKLNGTALFNTAKKNALAVYQFKDNYRHGVQLSYNNFPNTLFHAHNYDMQNEEGDFLHFITEKKTYENGILNGEYVNFSSAVDTTNYSYYIAEKPFGNPVAFYNSYYNTDRTYLFYNDTNLIKTQIVHLGSGVLLAEEDHISGVMQSFHFNGKIAMEIVPQQSPDTVCFAFRDTLGALTAKIFYLNHVLDYAMYFDEWGTKATIDFNNTDSLHFRLNLNSNKLINLVEYPFFKEGSKPHRASKSVSLDDPTGYTTRFSGQKKVAEGQLRDGNKSGLWNYYDASGEITSTVFYIDTILPGTYLTDISGKLTQYDSIGRIQFQAELKEYEKDYSCFDNNYVERYQLLYNIYNYKPASGTTIDHQNFYPNGVQMNAGQLVDGKPHGLWKMYRYDGSLYKMGKYDHGNKTGRWLTGDLSKLHFMGETCLDPSTTNYQEMLKEIDVKVEYFETGKLISSEFYNYRTKQ